MWEHEVAATPKIFFNCRSGPTPLSFDSFFELHHMAALAGDGPDRARTFRQSLHGSLESFQRDQRTEDAFYMALECVQANLDTEHLFEKIETIPDSDVEESMKEIAEKGLQSLQSDRIKSDPVFASIICADCLLRFSFQVT